MAEEQPPPIELLHVVCILCQIDFIVGREAFMNHFEEIDAVLEALALGQGTFKCGTCAGIERKTPALQ